MECLWDVQEIKALMMRRDIKNNSQNSFRYVIVFNKINGSIAGTPTQLELKGRSSSSELWLWGHYSSLKCPVFSVIVPEYRGSAGSLALTGEDSANCVRIFFRLHIAQKFMNRIHSKNALFRKKKNNSVLYMFKRTEKFLLCSD